MSYRPPSYSLADAPPPFVMRRLPPGTRYLGSDMTYWYFVHPGANPAVGLGDSLFDKIGNMFSRMVKITPKSFTPANISRSIWRITPVSWALQAAAPKIEKEIYKKVVPIAVPAIAAAAVAVKVGPAVWQMLAPKLAVAAEFLGKHADTIGKSLFQVMGAMGPSQQAQAAQEVTPEQIVAMEQGQAPPDYLRMLAAQSAPPIGPADPTSGAASLYDPQAMAAVELERQKREQGDFDPSVLLFAAVPVAAFFLWKK